MFNIFKQLLALVFLITGIPLHAFVPETNTPVDSAFPIFAKVNLKGINNPTTSNKGPNVIPVIKPETKNTVTKSESKNDKVVILSDREVIGYMTKTEVLSHDITEDYVIYHLRGRESFESADWVIQEDPTKEVGYVEVVSTPQLGINYVLFDMYYTKDGKYLKLVNTGTELMQGARNGFKIIGTKPKHSPPETTYPEHTIPQEQIDYHDTTTAPMTAPEPEYIPEITGPDTQPADNIINPIN